MYDNKRQHFYRPHMANYVYTAVSRCFSCTRNRRKTKKGRKSYLFITAGLLDFIAIDISAHFPKYEERKNYIFILKDRC